MRRNARTVLAEGTTIDPDRVVSRAVNPRLLAGRRKGELPMRNARAAAPSRLRTEKELSPRLKVHELKVEPLTAEAFKPFGKLFDARERPPHRRTLIYDQGFNVDGKTTVGVIWQPYAGRTFMQMERHFNVTQAFIPMDGSISVVAVAPPTDLDDPEALPTSDRVRAFLIDG
jgi:hypothetical protein